MATRYFSNLDDFAPDQQFYGQAYFEGGKHADETGYDDYAAGPWVESFALLIREFFAPQRVLDVGCARGYVVQQLRAWGVRAWGSDYSRYALDTAPPAVRSLLAQADAAQLPFKPGMADVVTCFETLEHLWPTQVPLAARELARLSRGFVFASMPTFGADAGGAQGIAIIDPEHQADAAAGQPFRKLILDERGQPHHGHLTLATWEWWTAQFEAAGLVRVRALEQQINAHHKAQPTVWHFYVFAHPQLARLDQVPGPKVMMGQTPAWQLGSGWHSVEGTQLPFRWTTRRDAIRRPLRVVQQTLVLHLAGGVRATNVRLEVAGRMLCTLLVQANWDTYRIKLPRVLDAEQLDMTFIVDEPLVPAQMLGSADERELGVMVAAVELQ
jgi:SAM-dependent methyltransferase